MNRRNFLKGFLATTAVVALTPLAPVVELSVQDATFDLAFDEIARMTLEGYRPILANNICNSRVTRVKWEMLYSAHCVKLEPGSKALVEPILYV